MKTHSKIFLILFAAFIITRLFLLFTSNQIHYPDDFFYGSMARELVAGADFRWYELHFDTYIGGSILTTLLITVVFKLFGIFKYSINLIPFLYSIIMFISFYFLTKRNYSKKVHLTSLLFLVFVPFTFIKFSLIPAGDFFAGGVLSVVIVFLLFEILRKKETKDYNFILLGLLCGYGIFHQYVILLSTLLCSFFLILKFKLHKKVLLFFGSMFVGLIPFLYFNLIYLNGFPKRFAVDIFTYSNIQHFFRKLFYSFFIELRNSTTYGHAILKLIYWLIFVCAFIFVIYKTIKSMGVSKENLRKTILAKRTYIYPILFLLLFFISYSNSYVGDYKLDSVSSMENPINYLTDNFTPANEFYYFAVWPLLFILAGIGINSIPNIWLQRTLILLVILISLSSMASSSNSGFFRDHRWMMNYCNENCFGFGWNDFSEEPIPKIIKVNGNAPGYRLFLRYYQQIPSSNFDPAYPMYLCSKMVTTDGKASCFKIVEASFEFHENKKGKQICIGDNELHVKKCLEHFGNT